MGKELCEAFPVFEEALEEACGYFDGLLGCSLRGVMFEEPGVKSLDRTMFAQAGLFAFEVALYRLLESWGLTPDYLLGHSIGELVAIHVAGAVSLQDACRLVAARGRLMDALPPGGGMVAVEASEKEALEALDGLDGRVGLAAVNGASAVVFSGEEQDLLDLARDWERRGRKIKLLRVSHAFHSQRMDPMLSELREAAASIAFTAPKLPVISNLTGEPLSGEQLSDPGYWSEHARAPVRFMDSVSWLAGMDVRTFLELGPDGGLSAQCRQVLDELRCDDEALSDGTASRPQALPTLRREGSEPRALVGALSQLWVRGVQVDWGALFGSTSARKVELPTYPFQRRRHWIETSTPRSGGDGAAVSVTSGVDGDLWSAVEAGDLGRLAETLGVEASPSGGSLEELLPTLDAWRRERLARSKIDDMRYRLDWKPVPEPLARSLHGSWLVAVGSDWRRDSSAVAIVQALERHGADVVPLELDMPCVERACLQRDAIRAKLTDALAHMNGDDGAIGSAPVGVLSLLAMSDGASHLEQGISRGLAATLSLVQALGELELEGRLWIATRGAVAVDASEPAHDPVQGLVWGLGRVIGWEYPQLWGGLIDLPNELDERSAGRLCGALGGATHENQLALRVTGLRGRRVVRAPIGSHSSPTPWRPHGTVLLTGGTGAIGTHVAYWLANMGAEHLVLASRSGEHAPGAKELVAELAEQGTRVTVAVCDVSDRGAVEGLLSSIGDDPPLSAIFHAAGASRGEWLRSVTDEQLPPTLAPKVQGAMHLHELTQHLDLQAFVLFSSITSIFGSAKLGVYSAGNAFLDALAQHRRARGLVATSISWSSWAGEGMAGDEEELSARAGLRSMSPDLTIKALAQVLDRDEAHTMVGDIQWDRTAPVFTLAHLGPLIGDLPDMKTALAEQTGVEGVEEARAGSFSQRLARMPGEQRRQAVLELVLSELASIMGRPASEPVSPEQDFVELGFDSVTVMGLRARLEFASGCQLPPTTIFDYPSADALAGYLLGMLDDASANGNPEGEQAPRPIAGDLVADEARSMPAAEHGTLGKLLVHAREDASLEDFMRTLVAMSRFRPVFEGHIQPESYRPPTELARGEGRPRVICVPSVLAISGPHQYLRFARGFAGERSVVSLTLPGFEPEEALPATFDAAVDVHVEGVRELAADGPFVLVGHSSGGMLAYALAARLEQMGIASHGVVMIDTYSPHGVFGAGLNQIVDGMLERNRAYHSIDDVRLTAMGAYLRLLLEWEPQVIDAPSLLLSAAEGRSGTSAAGDEPAAWELFDTGLEIPGDHFSAMEEHAEGTARAVEDWLGSIREGEPVG